MERDNFRMPLLDRPRLLSLTYSFKRLKTFFTIDWKSLITKQHYDSVSEALLLVLYGFSFSAILTRYLVSQSSRTSDMETAEAKSQKT